jgi:DNA-binding NarL/FixJ family response regulator
MEKVKVFLSDPQVLFREGIHFILSGEEEFDVIGETTSNQEAFTLIQANPPNVAILSILDGKFNGLEITRRIKRSLPSVSVILTMDKSDEDQLFEAMKSGASACLSKDTDPEELLNVIRVVAQGNQPITEALLIPGIASRTIIDFEDWAALSEQVDNLLANASPKESEILSSIADGNGIEQVAAKLDTNEEVVRRNLKLLLNKLVANDQAQTLIEATQRSLPPMVRGGTKRGKASADYVTREEFNEFKEILMARIKSLIGELA